MEFAQKISKKMPSMLKFAKKLTLTPQQVTDEDRNKLCKEAGLTDVEMLGRKIKLEKVILKKGLKN